MPSDQGDHVLIIEMGESARLIAGYIDGLTLESFDADWLRRDATAFRLLMIGEAAIHLSDSAKASLPQLNWRGMISLRHRLAHDYGSASSLVLWTIANEDVPALARALAS